jgi:hypothetical protein
MQRNRRRVFVHAGSRFAAARAIPSIATTHFVIDFNPSLGANGQAIADAVAQNCEADYDQVKAWFGLEPPNLPFQVMLQADSAGQDGTGGASHPTCPSVHIEADVMINPVLNPARSSFLVLAEVVEVFSAAASQLAWDCGASNGEGLSRVLAAARYPDELDGYATGPTWLTSARSDFVATTDPTDTNPLANGCAVLFLNFLHSQLGFGWDKIIAAGVGSLALTYNLLTSDSATNAFPVFLDKINAKFPPGDAGGLTTDNPFPY